MYALLMYVQCSDVVVDDDEDDMTSYDHTLLLTELSSMLATFRNPAVTHTL